MTRPSPMMSCAGSCTSSCPEESLHDSSGHDEVHDPALCASSSANACAFTTRSAARRRTPSSNRANRAGYTSLRMASATTSTSPRTPCACAFQAMASSVNTPTSGTPSAEAMPLAVAMAMRTPVNDPGPRPAHTQEICERATPSSPSSASMAGTSVVLEALCARTSRVATTSTSRSSARSSPTPIATTSLAVSNASTYLFPPEEKFPPHSTPASRGSLGACAVSLRMTEEESASRDWLKGTKRRLLSGLGRGASREVWLKGAKRRLRRSSLTISFLDRPSF